MLDQRRFILGSNIYVALRGPDACCCCLIIFVVIVVLSVREHILTGAPIHLILSLSYHFGVPRTPRHPGKLYGLFAWAFVSSPSTESHAVQVPVSLPQYF